jgi:tetratricopeptide (TPR) repeat protein
VLSASLAGAVDGQVLAAVRETARSDDELLPAIDRLSKKLRERIGESLVSIRADRPLEQVTTASLPALRKYTEALRMDEEDRQEEAIALLQEAVALDSGFAMAYRKLAVVLGNVNASTGRQFDAASRAFAHRDRLPELEAALTEAYYYMWVDYDPARVTAAHQAALAIQPENLVALNNQAVVLHDLRRYAEAESLAVKATRVGKGSSFFTNAIQAQVEQGHFEAAARTLEELAARSPASPVVLRTRAGLATAQGDYAAAERLALQLRAAQRSSPAWQAATTDALATLMRLQGRAAEAQAYLREHMSLSERLNQPGDYVGDAAWIAIVDVDLRNRPDSAAAVLAAAEAAHPLASIEPLDRPYMLLVLTNLKLGRLAPARRLFQDYEAAILPAWRKANRIADYVRGALAEAEGRPAEAEAAYLRWYESTGACGACGLFDLARLADKAGRTDSAIALYERGFAVPSMQRLPLDASQLAPALKRAGELYEAKGDRKKSAEKYGRFVELWKNADPDLQPGVREIRGRIARLASEGDR